MAKPDVSKPKEPPKPVHIGGESLVDRILPHLRKIIIGSLVLAGLVLLIFGIRWWKQRGEEKETDKIAEVARQAQQPLAAPGAKTDATHPFSDPADRAKSLLDQLSKLDANPPGHAYRASLLL